jgi:transcriptional regulator GlxA family with amidase domain
VPTGGLGERIGDGFAKARRIASVCTGAFQLAAEGLLDGRRATTHWVYADLLQKMYPAIKVQRECIYTKDGNIWTSAGVTAGIDLALALVEEDFGESVARATAQLLVIYHRRPGDQSQFSAAFEMDAGSERLRNVLAYMRENLTQQLSIEQLAQIACLSPRQFTRSFRAKTGETPAKAVERLRAEAARQRIELGMTSIELIAQDVGFTDVEAMSRVFIRLFGHPPLSGAQAMKARSS